MFCSVLLCWEAANCALHTLSNLPAVTEPACGKKEIGEEDLLYFESLLASCEEDQQQDISYQLSVKETEMEDMQLKMQIVEEELVCAKAQLETTQKANSKLRAKVNRCIFQKKKEKIARKDLEQKMKELIKENTKENAMFQEEKNVFEKKLKLREEEVYQYAFERGKECILREVVERVKNNMKEVENNNKQREEAVSRKEKAEAEKKQSHKEAEEAKKQAEKDRSRADECEKQLQQYENPLPLDLFNKQTNNRGIFLFNTMYDYMKGEQNYKAFEIVCGFLLESMTKNRVVRQEWQDGGVDLVVCAKKDVLKSRAIGFVVDSQSEAIRTGEHGRLKVEAEDEEVCALVQCKLNTSHKVNADVLRILVGSRHTQFRDCLALDTLYVITSHYFTKAAKEVAAQQDSRLKLIDRDGLIELFDKHYDEMIEKLTDFQQERHRNYELRQATYLKSRNESGSENEEKDERNQQSLTLSSSSSSLSPSSPSLSSLSSSSSPLSALLTPASRKTQRTHNEPLSTKNRKKPAYWSTEETLALFDAVEQYGRAWARIAQETRLLRNKDQGRLKDKWRNLQNSGQTTKELFLEETQSNGE